MLARYVKKAKAATLVERWSLMNAVIMLGASALALAAHAAWPVALAGAALFSALIWQARHAWSPGAMFGAANVVTAARLGLVLSLPLLAGEAPGLMVGAGLLILAADGLDGWLARRYGLSSEFGEFFDKETDALFFLLLCLLTVQVGALPVWIVGLGLLRYVFVVALFTLQPRETKEQRTSWARYIYVFAVLAVLAAFLPYPLVYQPLVAVAAAALCVSFARYFWWVLALRLTP